MVTGTPRWPACREAQRRRCLVGFVRHLICPTLARRESGHYVDRRLSASLVEGTTRRLAVDGDSHPPLRHSVWQPRRRSEAGTRSRQAPEISPIWSCDGPGTAGTAKKINLLLAGLCISSPLPQARRAGIAAGFLPAGTSPCHAAADWRNPQNTPEKQVLRPALLGRRQTPARPETNESEDHGKFSTSTIVTNFFTRLPYG
jgi:hypothetical protein